MPAVFLLNSDNLNAFMGDQEGFFLMGIGPGSLLCQRFKQGNR